MNLYKKYFITILLFTIFFVCPVNGYAQNPQLNQKNMRITRSSSIPNPFVPKLPKEVIEKPEEVHTSKGQHQFMKKLPAPIKSDAAMPTLHITGIIWNSDRPQAIINGEIIDIGDKISNAEVLDIRKSGVEVSFEGSTKIFKP